MHMCTFAILQLIRLTGPDSISMLAHTGRHAEIELSGTHIACVGAKLWVCSASASSCCCIAKCQQVVQAHHRVRQGYPQSNNTSQIRMRYIDTL